MLNKTITYLVSFFLIKPNSEFIKIVYKTPKTTRHLESSNSEFKGYKKYLSLVEFQVCIVIYKKIN